MRLFRTTLVFGIGFALGSPAVRQDLVAVARRIPGLARRPDIVERAHQKSTQPAGTLPQHLHPDGPAGHPSSGLQWPRAHRFPRHTASAVRTR
jgi:hypothetical protein